MVTVFQKIPNIETTDMHSNYDQFDKSSWQQ